MKTRSHRLLSFCIFLVTAGLFACLALVNAAPPTTLLEAVEANDLVAAKQSLASGAALETRDSHGWTPLIIATKEDHFEMAKLLVENGADVNAKSTSDAGNTVLCFAAGIGDLPLIDFYLQHGGQINAKSRNGTTPLFMSLVYQKEPAAQFLISKGARVDEFAYRSEEGHLITPLVYEVTKQDTNMVELLLKNGASLEKRDNYGWTALMFASTRSQPEMFKLLIDRGANVNSHTPNGDTPLLIAVENSEMEDVKVLLAAGANPKATETNIDDDTDNEGHDGVWWAKNMNRDPEMAALILEAQRKAK